MPANSDRVEDLPLVSIVVPAYNHEKYVGATIDSLIAQSYPNLELIVVNDGSLDATLGVINSRASDCERRFKRFVLIDQENAGCAAALNRGIDAAKASFVFPFASDDIVVPDAIQSLLPHMLENSNVALVCGDADFIDAVGVPFPFKRGEILYNSLVRFCLGDRMDVDLLNGFGSYASLLAGNYVSIGLMLRREFVLEVGGYDPDCAIEDLELWFKLAKKYQFRFVDRILSHYRWHGDNAISKRVVRIQFDETLLMIREAEFCAKHDLAEQWRTRARSLVSSLLFQSR